MVERRRRSVRYPLQLPLRVRWDEHEYDAQLENVSAGGALVRTDATPLLGSPIELEVRLPDVERSITTTARVVHIIHPSQLGPVGIGVEVVGGTHETWQQVVAYARRIAHEHDESAAGYLDASTVVPIILSC